MMAPLHLPPRWRLDGDYLVKDGKHPIRISLATFGLVEAVEITHSPWPDRVATIIEEVREQRNRGEATRRA